MRRFLRTVPDACGRKALPDRSAQFRGTQYLLAPTSFSPAGNTDLHCCYWFTLDTLPGVSDVVLTNTDSIPGDLAKNGWFTFVKGGGANLFGMGTVDPVGGVGVLTLAGFPLSANTWYFVDCWWDNSGAVANFTASLYSCAALLTSQTTAGLFINNNDPQLLKIGGAPGGGTFPQCRMDKFGIWWRANGSPVDGTTVWNGGNGLTYAQLVMSSEATGNKAYYDLDEGDGSTTYADGTGNFDATAVGTILAKPPHCQF